MFTIQLSKREHRWPAALWRDWGLHARDVDVPGAGSHRGTIRRKLVVVKNCEVLQVVAATWRLQNNRVCDARGWGISLEWTRASFKLSWSRRVPSFRKLSLLKGHAEGTWAWKLILQPLFQSYATKILWVSTFVSRHVISIPSAAGSADTGLMICSLQLEMESNNLSQENLKTTIWVLTLSVQA